LKGEEPGEEKGGASKKERKKWASRGDTHKRVMDHHCITFQWVLYVAGNGVSKRPHSGPGVGVRRKTITAERIFSGERKKMVVSSRGKE